MHKDDVRSNNQLSNLKWGTKRENTDDMVKKGRAVSLGNKPYLTSRQRQEIAKQPSVKRAVLAKKYGTSLSNISKIRHQTKGTS